MAGVTDAGDFASAPAPAEERPLGPLFDGPFARSKVKPTALEAGVAGMIWAHQGRQRPIALAEIMRAFGITERQVKGTVEELRLTHRCQIGARRAEPAGYFWIADADDREAAVRPYREQILSMWRTLRALDSKRALRELHGQLRVEETAGC